MTISTLLQILGACIGVIGSLFFAIGVMRQSVDSMANLSGTYFDFNPHRVPALAAQKADYLFGGGLIVISFSFNLLSFPFQNVSVGLSPNLENAIPWIAIPFTVVVFIALLACSRIVSAATPVLPPSASLTCVQRAEPVLNGQLGGQFLPEPRQHA